MTLRRMVTTSLISRLSSRPRCFPGSAATTPGAALSFLACALAFVTLSGITQCDVQCEDVDEEGNPILVPCRQCTLRASEEIPCKADSWFLPDRTVRCNQATQQPNLPDGELCDFAATGDGTCNAGVCVGPLFPCTEQGVLDAIAAGAGTIDCPGPTTVNTTAEIVIANDAVLDGSGKLMLDASGSHRVVTVASGVTAELRGVTVSGGDAGTVCSGLIAGDGICNAGHLTLTNVNVIANGGPTASGPAVFSFGNPPLTLRLVDSVVSGNEADPSLGASLLGGGVFAVGTVDVIRTTISDHVVAQLVAGNGAFVIPNLTNVLVEDSIIEGSAGFAAAFLGQVESVAVRGSTIGGTLTTNASGNVVPFIDLRESTMGPLSLGSNGGDAFIENSTVTASGATAISASGFDTVALSHLTVVSDTLAFEGTALGRGNVLSPGCDVGSTITSFGYNVDTDGTCGLSDPTDQTVSAAALNLGPLQDNGGPTHTIVPGAGSPTIDALPTVDCVDVLGIPLTTDQRGISRPQGGACDIGAVEVEQP